jgi:hypothetical protein
MLGVAILWVVAGAPRASAQHVIDFENTDLKGEPFVEFAPALAFLNVGGSGVTVTIQGKHLRIFDLFRFGGVPEIKGKALIDFPFPAGSNPDGTVILFDPPVYEVSLRAGDFAGDDDGPMTITAYDANGTKIGFDAQDWGEGQNPPFAPLTVRGSGIARVVYHSGGTYRNSTFIDDVTFMPMPKIDKQEP